MSYFCSVSFWDSENKYFFSSILTILPYCAPYTHIPRCCVPIYSPLYSFFPYRKAQNMERLPGTTAHPMCSSWKAQRAGAVNINKELDRMRDTTMVTSWKMRCIRVFFYSRKMIKNTWQLLLTGILCHVTLLFVWSAFIPQKSFCLVKIKREDLEYKAQRMCAYCPVPSLSDHPTRKLSGCNLCNVCCIALFSPCFPVVLVHWCNMGGQYVCFSPFKSQFWFIRYFMRLRGKLSQFPKNKHPEK